MAYPIYIPTRAVSIGGAAILESSDLLKIQVSIESSRSLVWDGTGFRFESSPKAAESTLGSEVVITLPRTDVSGWRDAASNSIIDVSAPDSYTHQYTATIRFVDATGGVVGKQYTLGPFTVPEGDGSTIDLDTTVPASTIAGGIINIPDQWGVWVAEAQAAAAAAEASLIDSDAFIADQIATPGTQTQTQLTTTIAGSSRQVPVVNYVNEGETLAFDGSADASVIIQRAINAAAALVAAHGPQQVILPAGRFRLNSALAWASGVGLHGPGRDAAVLLPYGSNSAILKNQLNDEVGKTWMDDCSFKGFTIDCINQSGTLTDSAIKGIFIQFMRRARFEDVAVKNSWMTGFGLDYLIDSAMINCYAENAGRGGTNLVGAGAGFGIAVGFYDVETLTISNCVSKNNKTHGFFTENKGTGGPTKFSRGFKLVSSSASGNNEGFRDGGSTGAIVSDCDFSGNLSHGVSIGATPANGSGGGDGAIRGCFIYGNGANGIQIEKLNAGYLIESNTILRNTNRGINRGTTTAVRDVTIRDNRIIENGDSGIGFLTSGAATGVTISGNELIDNGQTTGSSYRDGITIISPTTQLTLRGNRAHGRNYATQQRGIDVRSTSPVSVQPVIQGNDVRGNVVTEAAALRVQHVVADAAQIKENIVDPAGAPSGTVSDNFNRADGTGLGSTPVGGKTWTVAGSASPFIASNTAGVTVTSGNGYVYVDAGASDGTFSIKLATSAADASAFPVFRYVDTSNHLSLNRVSSGDHSWRLCQRVSGTQTTIATLSTPVASGDVITVTLAGTTVTVKINDVQVYTGTVTALSTATGFGFGAPAAGSDARWDDFSLVA